MTENEHLELTARQYLARLGERADTEADKVALSWIQGGLPKRAAEWRIIAEIIRKLKSEGVKLNG